MKSVLLAAVMSLTAIPAYSDDFYSSKVGNWLIFGDHGDSELNPACVVSYEWQDGSEFQLIYDLPNRELFIYFENFDWDIIDPEGYYKLNMVIVGSGNNLQSGELDYYLMDKNSINIPDISPVPFLEAFAGLNELRFIMPGDIPNAYLGLRGSRAATERLMDCIDVGRRSGLDDNKPLGHDL